GGPDVADAVGHDGRPGGDVRGGVDGEVGGVGGRADARAAGVLAEEPVADAAGVRAGVAGLHREHEAEVVAPALAHLLGVREAAHAAGPADEAVRDAVAVLVQDDAVVEAAVALDRVRVAGRARDVHLHPRALAVGRREEVGVAGAGAIL